MKQELQLLKLASQEIKSLRIQNERMGLRLQMFDDLMSFFNTVPCRVGHGMGQDITYDIDKLVKYHELSEEEKDNLNSVKKQ